MADLDLNAIAASELGSYPIVEALVAAVRWAQDAPHHDGCYRWKLDRAKRRCTCGRDEALAPFGCDQ